MESKDLLNTAKETLKNAYAPYSEFKVGAAILTKDGEVFTGCNVENASYGATICAERGAISKMVAMGGKKPEKIAIVARDAKGNWVKAYPCGICRQVLAEFNVEIDIILEDENGIEEINLLEIFSKTFSL